MSTTPRFFVPPEAIVGSEAVLPPEVLHHARTVLRLRPGEILILHDGRGFAHEAIFGEGKSSTVVVRRSYPLKTEPVLRITVAQALTRTGEKMEQVLQHGTEIGAAGFIVFPAERSVARPESAEKWEKRKERWAAIVKSASEQSRRAVLPTVEWEPRLAAVAERLGRFDLAVVLHESAEAAFRTVFPPPETPIGTLLLLVGPEGGWTENEVEVLARVGGRPVNLGPRILRTETAALAALAQALYAREP
ncbi:MAG: RsmE family RNA methyltransferase [Capsulimonadales bacterium]|nr:RsmE family RNA methyltransferase [Capsulimonadales bacterium]